MLALVLPLALFAAVLMHIEQTSGAAWLLLVQTLAVCLSVILTLICCYICWKMSCMRLWGRLAAAGAHACNVPCGHNVVLFDSMMQDIERALLL
jgi:hypothetical protein